MEIRTLGAAAAFRADGSRIEGLTPESKRFAVLVRVALAGSCRRDELAMMLWPDLDQEHARGALRQVLRYLRQAIGSSTILNRGDEELALAPGAVWCDAIAFERAIGEGRASDAWKLYGGDFLDTVHVGGAAPEFTDWMEGQRLRLRRLASRTAWRLADDMVGSGDVPHGMDFARRAFLLAGDSEPDLARLLTLLAATGDRAGALAEYEQFAGRLAREYDAEPSPQTQTLISEIRAQTISATEHGSSLPGSPAHVDQSTSAAHATLPLVTLKPAPTVPYASGSVPTPGRTRRSGWHVVALVATTLLALIALVYAVRREGRSAFAATQRTSATEPSATRRHALELTVRGEYYLTTRLDADAMRARDLFEDAIDRDPTMTRAYVGLAYTYGMFAHNAMMPSREAFRLSAAAASKARMLDSTSGMAIAQLSAFKAYGEWRWSDAEEGYRRAITREPGNADLHVLYGTYLRVLGRYAESAREFRRARELEPLVRHFSNQEARVLLCARRTDAALALAMSSISLGERSPTAHTLAADALAALHRYDEALHEYRVASELVGDSSAAATLGHLRGSAGYATMRLAQARAAIQDLGGRARRGLFVSPTHRAAAYALAGDWQNAYAWLDSAVQSRDVLITKVGCNPSFDGMRADPRFLAIAARVGVSAGMAK